MLHPPSMYKVWRCWTMSIAVFNILSYHTFRSQLKLSPSSSDPPHLHREPTTLLGSAPAHWPSLPIHHAFRVDPSPTVTTAKVIPPSLPFPTVNEEHAHFTRRSEPSCGRCMLAS